jgi:hypothetical protein
MVTESYEIHLLKRTQSNVERKKMPQVRRGVNAEGRCQTSRWNCNARPAYAVPLLQESFPDFLRRVSFLPNEKHSRERSRIDCRPAEREGATLDADNRRGDEAKGAAGLCAAKLYLPLHRLKLCESRRLRDAHGCLGRLLNFDIAPCPLVRSAGCLLDLSPAHNLGC